MGMFTRKNRTEQSRRLLCVLLTLALGLPMLPVKAGAVSLTNRVAVEVTTGESAGDRVMFLGLNYLDTNDVLHVEYVFPQRDALRKAFDTNRKLSATEEIKRLELMRMNLLGDWDYGDQKALQPYSTDTFVFDLPFTIDEDDPNWFQGLEVYCEGDPGGGGAAYSWDVQGLRIYTGGGAEMCLAGGAESKYQLLPYGRKAFSMAEEGGRSLSWTSDTLYKFGADSRSDVLMKQDSGVHTEDGQAEYYTFRIDFADIYGGGIEALAQAYQGNMKLGDFVGKEALVMEVQYTDTWGNVIRTRIPVINSVLASLNMETVMPDSAITDKFEDLVLLGWAQQGESIAFSACLPDLVKVNRVTFYSGSEAAKRTNLEILEEDGVSITSVSVYPGRMDGSNAPADTNAVLVGDSDGNDLNEVFTFRSKPLYYHTASSYAGETIVKDGNHLMIMTEYTSGSNLTPVNGNERYLVELKATEIGFSDTPEDIYLQIKYRTVKGEQRETSKISIRSAARDFYGYWPASADDFAYKAMMYQEGTGGDFGGIKFVVELRDVEYFTGVVLDSGTTQEDWQMTGIQVSRLEDISARNGEWKEVSYGGVQSDREYTRSTYGDVIFTMNETVLVQPGESEEMDFTSGSVVTGEEVDWSDVKYAMSYDESCANFGFTKSRETYTVEVKVSGDTVSLDGNGDNGSKNQFFFQLEFEGGNSGYVLANQQLSADGFRSGYSETFTITTNRNYGELVAVHIIPDDTSEDSDVYDKLNIEEIKVRRNTTDSVSRQWTVSEVGWIGIDYRDEGAGVSIGGQEGRTEAEIARIYPVTYRSYGINLMFNINTGSYASENAEANTDAFYGTVNGTLWYTNSIGESVSHSFDLVEEIYKYANRDPVYGTDENGRKTSAINDTDYMFRGNHTDRFFLSVDDIVQINRLDLNVTSFTGGSWTINNVAIQQVLSDGVLQISDNDEYVRTNETKPLCADEEVITLVLPKGERQTKTIYFPPNKIEVDQENFTWVSTVSREPVSQNDEINIYIYPEEPSNGEYEIDASVMYTNAFGNRWRTGAEDLNRHQIDGREVFSIQGLSATGMSSLNNLTIEADIGRNVMLVNIDHAVVQQVRAGVVIRSYYLNCQNKNAAWGITVEPYTGEVLSAPEQVVSLALEDLTEAANLVPEVRDIAVAIRYTSANESSGREYLSRYVFLTDEGYTSIRPGDVLTLTFNEEYVREVTGITLVASGGIVADVARASVGVYEVTAGEEETVRKQTGWYSFADGTVLDNSSKTLTATPNYEVYPLEMQFVTADAGGTTESGTDAPVAMTMGYKTGDGSIRTWYFDDIRDYVVSSGSPFATGSVTTLKMLVTDAVELRWMELEPHDDLNSKATLRLKSVSALLGDEGSAQRVNRALDESIVFEEGAEDPYRLNLSNVSVEFDVRAINPDTGDYDMQPHVVKSIGETVKLATKSGGGARIENITVNDSDAGYTVKTELVTSAASVSAMDHLTRVTESDTVLFSAPANKSGSAVTYRITVASKEVPDVMAVVEIEVMNEPVVVENVVPDAGESTDQSTGENAETAENAENAESTESVDQSAVPEGGTEENSAGTEPSGESESGAGESA